MKVLIVSEYFFPLGKGGGEISGFLFAKELTKNKIGVHVLTSFFYGMKKEEIIDKVRIHRLLRSGKNPNSLIDNIKRRWFFEKSLLKELENLDKKENFDIIHCMNATSISAVKLKDKLKKKFVLHVNSPVLFCPKGTLMYKDRESCDRKCDRKTFLDCYMNSKFIGKFEPNLISKINPFFIYVYRKRYEEYQNLMKGFDHYIAISKFMESCLIRDGIDKKKISIIYPLIELDKFINLEQSKNKIPKILYLGEYSKPKGPQLIIDALKKVNIPYEANFYGEGVLKGYLTEQTKNNKLNVKIYDKIKYEDIPHIMEKHDIVIVPSLVSEGFGRVALEAIAAGKYVIANDIGGLGEVVKGSGCLVDVRDSRMLARKIEVWNKNKPSKKDLKRILGSFNLKGYLEILKK
jgi:glycosyltransferase involved in cell wall biosynthesis